MVPTTTVPADPTSPANLMVPAVLIAMALTATPTLCGAVLVAAASESVRYHFPAVRAGDSAALDRYTTCPAVTASPTVPSISRLTDDPGTDCTLSWSSINTSALVLMMNRRLAPAER